MMQTNIYPEEQLPAKYYVTKYLELLLIQNMIDTNKNLPRWHPHLLTKNLEKVMFTQEQTLFLRIKN